VAIVTAKDKTTMNTTVHSFASGSRLAYTMIRVRDLARSLAFYTGPLGMKLFRRQEFPEGRFTLAFVGYGEEGSTTIELTHNWDDQEYTHGSGFGHIAIQTPDVYAATSLLAEAGVEVIRPAGPMTYDAEVIAFVRDPDGYRIELVEGH
jgi:lactoylglutathione lyase